MENSTNNLDQIFTVRGCLTMDEMVGYSKESLSDVHAHQIEAHLIGCPFCTDAMQGMAAYANPDKFTEMVNDINEKVDQEPVIRQFAPTHTPSFQPQAGGDPQPQPFFARYGKYMAVAAAITLLAIFGLQHFSTSPTSQGLLAEFYPELIPPVHTTAGAQAANGIFKMVDAFDQGNHAVVISMEVEFPKGSENYIPAQLFVAQSLIENGDATAALEILQRVSNSGNPDFSEMAEWLLGKVYLKSNNIASAKALFEKIANSDSGYKLEAAKALKQISKID